MKPSKTEFKKLAENANLIPVYAELLADMSTPLSAFANVRDKRDSFLFESAESIENFGRYSFIGFEPKAVFTINGTCGEFSFADGKREVSENSESPFAPLKNFLSKVKPAQIEGLPGFFGGAVGFLSYESAGLFEKLPPAKNESGWENARFGIFDKLMIFDNVRHTVKILCCVHTAEFENLDDAYEAGASEVKKMIDTYKAPLNFPQSNSVHTPISLKSNMTKEEFVGMTERAKQYIKDGEAIQIVLSQKFTSSSDVDPLAAYRALRFINPSPYMFCLKCGEKHLVGASPETLVRTNGGKVQASPIAGTRPRGKNQNDDIKLADELLSDEKERAEHLMLVDLGRNDLSRFCESGSVQIESFMEVQRYSHVMHLVSHIAGEMKSGRDSFDAIAACFPAGTLSGAPKVRAMEIINELEPETRGAYGGAVGYISYGGAMDLAITIRTLQIQGGKLCVQAGAGIVYDSDPEAEYRETKSKAEALARAIAASSNLEEI